MEISSHQTRLLEHLDRQRKQEMFCDCRIVVEDRVFKAHRNVLFASSGYFRMLLLHNAQEAGKPTVATFDVFSADAFVIILDFVYSGRLSLTSQNVIDVMSAASYLQMTDVIGVCKSFIKSSLDISEKEERYFSHSSSKKSKCGEGASVFAGTARSLESGLVQAQKNPDVGRILGHSWRSFNLHHPMASLQDATGDQSQNSFADSRTYEEVSSELPAFKSVGSASSSPRVSEQINMGSQTEEKKLLDSELNASHLSYQFQPEQEALPAAWPQGRKERNSEHQPSRTRGQKTDDWYPPMPTILEVVGDWSGDSTGDYGMLPNMKFKCPFCTHTVKRKSDLKRHLRSHTGERPYPCDSCGKRFTRLEHLRSHVITIHKSGKLLNCKVCRKSFTGMAAKIVQHHGKCYGLCSNCVSLMNSVHDDEPIDLDPQPDHDVEFQESDRESGWISAEPEGESEILSSGGEGSGSNEIHTVHEILDDADEKVQICHKVESRH
ncbi:zinc finger and BTB domain-containing protein 8A [Callorhinchus milii]|uniref:zinc finger and BTB domain-containing protein 8A n=1 Tax=Callorhinchus milii TaxID=7868 RepID=UPI001C3FA8A5|nr:zinc finger and BTB domain-containing protein 8A [Callorhinchus milii]